MSSHTTTPSSEVLTSLNALVDGAIAGYSTQPMPEGASTGEVVSGETLVSPATEETAASSSIGDSEAATIATAAAGTPVTDNDGVPTPSTSGASASAARLPTAAEVAQEHGLSKNEAELLEAAAHFADEPPCMSRSEIEALGIHMGPEDMDPRFAALFDWETFAPRISLSSTEAPMQEESAPPALDDGSESEVTIIVDDQDPHRTPRASPAPHLAVPAAVEGLDIFNMSALPRLGSSTAMALLDGRPDTYAAPDMVLFNNTMAVRSASAAACSPPAPRPLPERWVQHLSLPQLRDFQEAFAADLRARRAYMPRPDYGAEWEEWEAEYCDESSEQPPKGWKPARRPPQNKAANKRAREPEDGASADAPGAKRPRGPGPRSPPPPPPPSSGNLAV